MRSFIMPDFKSYLTTWMDVTNHWRNMCLTVEAQRPRKKRKPKLVDFLDLGAETAKVKQGAWATDIVTEFRGRYIYMCLRMI